MDIGNATESLALLGGGGLSMMAFARWYFARLLAEMDHRQEVAEGKIEAQAREIATLKDERMAGLEEKMQRFADGCAVKHDRLGDTLTKVEHMAADLANMVGWTKKIDGKLDRIAETQSAQGEAIKGNDRWLANLDAAHQAHVGDRGVHR